MAGQVLLNHVTRDLCPKIMVPLINCNMADVPDFDSLVVDYYRALYQFAVTLTRDEADACDLTQHTFYIWVNKGHQLREKSKLKSWLFTTLYREFLGSRGRQNRFPHFEVESIGTGLATVPAPSVNKQDSEHLLAALAQLDELYRAPVALFYLQDYSYHEIAEILEVSVGTVKSRLARGIGHLHDLLTVVNQNHQPIEPRRNEGTIDGLYPF
jgi:RNA polymerase sigma-70 factor (ECF subfamily)